MYVVRNLALVFICLILGACSSALRWSSETHIVQSGETVYSIAFQNGVDQRDLIGWNRLDSGGLIFAGQRLRLTAPDGYTPGKSSSSAATTRRQEPVRRSSSGQSGTSAVKWRWPTEGSVISAFGATAKTQSGIHIAGKRGQPILAAASGEVVYAGNSLPGYGQLLIIKHSSDYLSAYGHNQKLLVGEGDRVTAGQLIAKMGDGPGQRPLLHFEIRRSGKPVNPMGYLPKH
jgi:lipoprotein NlpD